MRYRKGPGFERVKMLLGNGLIVSDGEVWRRARRMIQPAFTRQNIHRLIGLMIECTRHRASMWRNRRAVRWHAGHYPGNERFRAGADPSLHISATITTRTS